MTESGQRPGRRQGRRGREARWPGQIPWRGWWDIARRIKAGFSDDYLSLVAAGVAFYGLLAVFPALVAVVSLYGLVADPVDVQRQLTLLQDFLPDDAIALLGQQLQAVARQSDAALGTGAAGSLLLAVWSSARGARALIMALNIVYGEREKRGLVRFYALALLFTIGVLATIVIALVLIVGLSLALELIGLHRFVENLMALLRWPLLIGIALTGLALIYRYGPSRRAARWRWISWGALLATLLWVAGSALFSYYVSHFASYNRTYGSIGAVVILLMWFYLSAFVVLVGAKINAEMEHQTGEDSTAGGDQPMGSRGAYVADTLGRAG